MILSTCNRVEITVAAEEEAGNQGFVKIEPELPRYDGAIFGEPTWVVIYCSSCGTVSCSASD